MEKKFFKGVSPLVATIVLIGITLVIAALIATFVQTTVIRQLTITSECTQAKGYIERGSYDDNTQNLTLYVVNNGRINLTFNSFVAFLNGSVQSGGQFPSPAGQTISHIINDIDNDIQHVQIQSVQCVVVDVLEGRFISGI